MDEPHEVTAGLDDSLASEVGDRVRKIVDDAERDAIAKHMEADDAVRAAVASAHAEAERLRDDAVREAQLTAEERVSQMRELQRLIEARAEELAALADDPESVMADVDPFLEALEARAALVAREAAVPAAQERAVEPGREPEHEPEPAADVEPEPESEPEPVLAANITNGATVATAAVPHPVLPGSEAELLEEARLGALRMAVAGAPREELEPVLRQIFRPDDAVAVLDDVYGRPRSPFPKWAAAAKRAG
jgi:hypothetical protein